MNLFYGKITQNHVEIDSAEQHHIQKVLRMREGSKISVTDGNGHLAHGILHFEGKKVLLQVTKTETKKPPLSPALHVALAPTKNIDRTEFFVEKATEMGVSEITFLLTENSERKHLNIERIEKKVISACKQSQRVYFPKINPMISLSEFLENSLPKNTYVAHCHSKLERTDLKEIVPQNEICFLIGPEGDFSLKEIEMLKEKQIKAVSFGFQRLRTETAGIFIAAWNYSKMI